MSAVLLGLWLIQLIIIVSSLRVFLKTNDMITKWITQVLPSVTLIYIPVFSIHLLQMICPTNEYGTQIVNLFLVPLVLLNYLYVLIVGLIGIVHARKMGNKNYLIIAFILFISSLFFQIWGFYLFFIIGLIIINLVKRKLTKK